MAKLTTRSLPLGWTWLTRSALAALFGPVPEANSCAFARPSPSGSALSAALPLFAVVPKFARAPLLERGQGQDAGFGAVQALRRGVERG